MVDQIIQDTKLLTLLDQYAMGLAQDGRKVSDIIRNLARGMKNPELIVPVLGMQGTGKSTLINGILGEQILPSDVDETTCVPVEIRYGTRKMATVYFRSGKQTEIPISCDALKEYVDNNQNKGNEKDISHIAFQLPLDLLKSGLVIVDLPGVGSLTQRNQETTMRYIRQLCTAIFLIPTVPPIRRSEEIFIRGVWSSFSSAIFVQNQWNGEREREVREAIEHNTLRLKDIARKLNIAYDGKVSVVNAYKASVATREKNWVKYEHSNIRELLDELKRLGENRIELDKKRFIEKIKAYIETAQTVITEHISESQMGEEQRQAEKTRIRQEFLSATNELQQLVDGLLADVKQEKKKADDFARELSKKHADNLRAKMFELINGGLVDGEQLTESFSNNQEECLMDAIDEHYNYMSRMTYEIEKKLEVLENKLQVERALSFEAQKFENGQAFKFEKLLEVGIDIVGVIGGAYTVGAVGGVVAGEFGGLLGSFAGPVGIAIGFLAGAGVSILVGMLGKETRSSITAERASRAKRAIRPYIKTFEEKLYNTISAETNSALDAVSQILCTYMEDRKEYYEQMMRSEERATDEAYAPSMDISEMNNHYAYLESRKERLV